MIKIAPKGKPVVAENSRLVLTSPDDSLQAVLFKKIDHGFFVIGIHVAEKIIGR